jgi:hypothetical protein
MMKEESVKLFAENNLAQPKLGSTSKERNWVRSREKVLGEEEKQF